MQYRLPVGAGPATKQTGATPFSQQHNVATQAKAIPVESCNQKSADSQNVQDKKEPHP
jgi:hypothetical protein